MRVGDKVHGSPRSPTSACDHKVADIFDGLGLALCCGPRRVGRHMRVGLLLVSRWLWNESLNHHGGTRDARPCLASVRGAFPLGLASSEVTYATFPHSCHTASWTGPGCRNRVMEDVGDGSTNRGPALSACLHRSLEH
jgi:hypothetical protein